MSNSTSMLRWKIFVAPAVPTVSDDLPLGETTRMWSPISSIPIHGERDAMLVDTPTTAAQAVALADWVEKSGKNLRTVCPTHGHGDHFFGKPSVVIAGHKRECNSDGPNIIEETRQYIRDFDRLVDKNPRRLNCTRQC